MIVKTKATVWYSCYISEENAEKVRKYAEENDTTLEEAVQRLYDEDDEFYLYDESNEIDFCTDAIEEVEDE